MVQPPTSGPPSPLIPTPPNKPLSKGTSGVSGHTIKNIGFSLLGAGTIALLGAGTIGAATLFPFITVPAVVIILIASASTLALGGGVLGVAGLVALAASRRFGHTPPTNILAHAKEKWGEAELTKNLNAPGILVPMNIGEGDHKKTVSNFFFRDFMNIPAVLVGNQYIKKPSEGIMTSQETREATALNTFNAVSELVGGDTAATKLLHLANQGIITGALGLNKKYRCQEDPNAGSFRTAVIKNETHAEILLFSSLIRSEFNELDPSAFFEGDPIWAVARVTIPLDQLNSVDPLKEVNIVFEQLTRIHSPKGASIDQTISLFEAFFNEAPQYKAFNPEVVAETRAVKVD